MYRIEGKNVEKGYAKWLNTCAAIYTEVVVIRPLNPKNQKRSTSAQPTFYNDTQILYTMHSFGRHSTN